MRADRIKSVEKKMCDWSKEAFNKNENIIETEELFKGEKENRFGCSAAELIAKQVHKEIEGPKGFNKLVLPQKLPETLKALRKGLAPKLRQDH